MVKVEFCVVVVVFRPGRFDFLELKLLFSLFDMNRDGQISEDEIKHLVEVVSGHPWSDEQLAAFMHITDTDRKTSPFRLFLFSVRLSQEAATSVWTNSPWWWINTFRPAHSAFAIYSISSVRSKTDAKIPSSIATRLDLSADGTVDQQEFEQVIKERPNEFNVDQTEIFRQKFQQDPTAPVTYEGLRRRFVFSSQPTSTLCILDFVAAAKELYQNLKFRWASFSSMDRMRHWSFWCRSNRISNFALNSLRKDIDILFTAAHRTISFANQRETRDDRQWNEIVHSIVLFIFQWINESHWYFHLCNDIISLDLIWHIHGSSLYVYLLAIRFVSGRMRERCRSMKLMDW